MEERRPQLDFGTSVNGMTLATNSCPGDYLTTGVKWAIHCKPAYASLLFIHACTYMAYTGFFMHWLVLMQVHPQEQMTCKYLQIQMASDLYDMNNHDHDSELSTITAEPPVGDLVENDTCSEISQETP